MRNWQQFHGLQASLAFGGRGSGIQDQTEEFRSL